MVGGGLGSAVGRTHVVALRMDGEYELVAGCFSRDPATNAASGAAYGLPPEAVLPDLATLLADGPPLDAVVVATPIRAHERQLHQVLDAGVTAITDKPLAHDAAGARRLARRVAGAPERLFTLFNYTGYPAVRDLRDRVRRGRLGRLHRVVLEMPQDTYQRLVNIDAADRVQDWRLVDGASACVSLDLFVHLHSLAVYVTGRSLRRVTARSRSVTGIEPGLVDDVDALLEFDGGLHGTAWFGKAALGSPNGLRMRVLGERGAAEWDQSAPNWLRLADAAGRVTLQDHATVGSSVAADARYQRFKAGHPAGFLEAFANSYVDVARAVRAGAPNEHTLPIEVAVEGLAACEAITRSATSGRPVDVAVGASPAARAG